MGESSKFYLLDADELRVLRRALKKYIQDLFHDDYGGESHVEEEKSAELLFSAVEAELQTKRLIDGTYERTTLDD